MLGEIQVPLTSYLNCQFPWRDQPAGIPDARLDLITGVVEVLDPYLRRYFPVDNERIEPLASADATGAVIKLLGDSYIRACRAARSTYRTAAARQAAADTVDQGGPAIRMERVLAFYTRAVAATLKRHPAQASMYRRELQGLLPMMLVDPGDEDVVAAVSELMLDTSVADAVMLGPLVIWASSNRAQPRTRVFALKALSAMFQRGGIPLQPALIKQLENLRQSIADLDAFWPKYGDDDKRVLAFFVAEANALTATMAQKLAEKGLDTSTIDVPMPEPKPPYDWGPWKVVGGATAAAVAVLGLSLAYARKPAAAPPRRRGRR